MAMSNAELGERIGQQQQQIQDLATQTDNLTHLLGSINVGALKQDIIDTFARCQSRLTALEAKMVDLDTEMDKTQDKVKEAKSDNTGFKNSLVDNKMVPDTFEGTEKQSFRQWARKVKSYCNGRKRGFREAMLWAEAQTVVDDVTLATVAWEDGHASNYQLAELLIQITGE